MAQRSRHTAESLGEQFARARKAAGITQAQLAQKTGLQQSAISRFERGLANPTLETLETLAAGIGAELHLGFLPKRSGSFTLTHTRRTHRDTTARRRTR